MDIERNLGQQPLSDLMVKHGVTPRDVVTASPVQITHKMVQRAQKGRRLSAHVMVKIQKAFNAATSKQYGVSDLFNYTP